jgi:hypothetical protein
MRYHVVGEGFVSRRPSGKGPDALAVGPRCLQLPGGELLCSFMLTSGLGTNDFTPTLFRSRDGGVTWQEQGEFWAHLRECWSIFASISRDAAGNVYFFGSRTPIGNPGEPFWSDATQGLKQNELVWARSTDGGRTWPDPTAFALPLPGAAEAPGALCVTRAGAWIAPYSPYNTFDPEVVVTRNQVVLVRSEDQGRTWGHAAMMSFEDPASSAAEAWCIELADGRLLGVAWQMHHEGDYPNPYTLSHDGGRSWSPPRSTGIQGQSTALAALPDGRALFVYNQRKHGDIGVWLAVARPTDAGFRIEHNAPIWKAETGTQSGTSGEHSEWGDFSFGEPSIAPLADGALIATLWSIQPTGRGIRWVKLKME